MLNLREFTRRHNPSIGALTLGKQPCKASTEGRIPTATRQLESSETGSSRSEENVRCNGFGIARQGVPGTGTARQSTGSTPRPRAPHIHARSIDSTRPGWSIRVPARRRPREAGDVPLSLAHAGSATQLSSGAEIWRGSVGYKRGTVSNRWASREHVRREPGPAEHPRLRERPRDAEQVEKFEGRVVGRRIR